MNQIVSERVADGFFFRLKLIKLKMFGGFFKGGGFKFNWVMYHGKFFVKF